MYIQKHAFRRLDERLDSLPRSTTHSYLYASMLTPELHPIGENRALIAYTIVNTKMGYLVAEYIDGAVLIHTFLFITNNGTPEGKKLYEFTGLGMLDKKYLALDKMSSFIKSDIGKNEKLKTVFEKAGCGCLLNIDDFLQRISTKQADNKNTDLILRYLKTDVAAYEEEELVVGSD